MGRITNLKRKKFVKELLKTGNRTEAVARTYPNMKRSTAGSYATELMKNENVQREIREAMIEANLTPDTILKHTSKIVAKGSEQLDSQRVSPELYAKTLNDLLRIYTKLGKSIKQQTNININVDATTPQLLKKRQEYSSFFNNIIEGESIGTKDIVNDKVNDEGTPPTRIKKKKRD